MNNLETLKEILKNALSLLHELAERNCDNPSCPRCGKVARQIKEIERGLKE